jgi:hypothetical protein
MNLAAKNFNPTLLNCTMLNPEKSAELSPKQFDHGKIELVRFLTLALAASNPSTGVANADVAITDSGECSSNDPVCSESTSVSSSDALKASQSKRRRLGLGSTATVRHDVTLDEQIAKFMCILEDGNFISDVLCFDFWREHAEEFSAFTDLELLMLSILATSVTVEQLYSTAGISASGHRTIIGPALPEAEAIVKYN